MKSTRAMEVKLSRRAVWQGLGGFAALSWSACATGAKSRRPWLRVEKDVTLSGQGKNIAWAQVPLSRHFPMGLASGDPSPDGIVLSSLYLGEKMIRVWVWPEDALGQVPLSFEQEVHVGEGGYFTLEVSGLAPHTKYSWGILELDSDRVVGRSESGRFRTAPSSEAMPVVRLAAFSCTMQWFEKTTLEEAVAHEGPFDAALVAGDSTYADGAKTIADYRQRWRDSLESHGWKALRANTSLVATWDDHEFVNNVDPEKLDKAQLENAKRAFFEVTPIRAQPGQRLWRKVSFGQTVDVFVLDVRTERQPSSRLGLNPVYLSNEQFSWLKAELKASTACFKLLLNSTPVSDFPGGFDMAQADRWEGYAAQREELLRFIDAHAIEGLLWVSGDFHLASVGAVALSGPGASQTEILVGPAAQFGNPLTFELQPPQFQWASNEENVTVLELNPNEGTVRCRWRGKTRVLHETTLTLARPR